MPLTSLDIAIANIERTLGTRTGWIIRTNHNPNYARYYANIFNVNGDGRVIDAVAFAPTYGNTPLEALEGAYQAFLAKHQSH